MQVKRRFAVTVKEEKIMAGTSDPSLPACFPAYHRQKYEQNHECNKQGYSTFLYSPSGLFKSIQFPAAIIINMIKK